MGSIVAANITLTKTGEDPKSVAKRVKHYCREKLQGYKVPARIKILNENNFSSEDCILIIRSLLLKTKRLLKLKKNIP